MNISPAEPTPPILKATMYPDGAREVISGSVRL